MIEMRKDELNYKKDYIELLMQLGLWKSAINEVAITDGTSVERVKLARVITEIENYMKERRISVLT